MKQYLIKQDRKLRPLIARIPFPSARRNRDVYATLLHSIIAQQLSVKAADTIHARVLALFPENYPEPSLLRRMPVARLRAAGLSRQKTEYLKSIARFAMEEGMAYSDLAKRSDEQIIEQLTQIHGVGRWTVEMLLIFSFNRRDVFSVDDVGIQNAMRALYGLDQTGKAFKLALLDIAEHWRPYRAIVCKYLWRWKALNPAGA
ncbi:MAG: DNA-3-methyladenine glycosylase 2 family protein [Gammaproteobacteria bacterium]|nr:DNA-3-methyladenine glycosylase 2 family protein [Gammaproteobacteria bacterium]